ncbi:uncharacterized protein LOC134846778 [Symsagittifera roscoffensis]|uniref:uncharacterized protein LOC134846778 n=1 Tax=Symsagittifera roscoffensis TaxID=84072 RepID=UPI00307BCC2F
MTKDEWEKISDQVLTRGVQKTAEDILISRDSDQEALESQMDTPPGFSDEPKKTNMILQSRLDVVAAKRRTRDPRELNSIDDLERLQFKLDRIVNEINQATMLQIVKEENQKKGYKRKKSETSLVNSKPARKADQMMSRDLPQYISNLNFAKTRCERRIQQLGGSLGNSCDPGIIPTNFSKKSKMRQLAIANSQTHVLPASINEILKCEEGFQLFQGYLENEFNQSNWSKFWKQVEIMRKEHSVAQYRMADKIYHDFIHYCTDPNFKLPTQIAENMHQYVLGNSTIRAFFEAQNFVAKQMERHFLPGFLVTSGYKKWRAIQEEKKQKTLELESHEIVRSRSRTMSFVDSKNVAVSETTKLNELRDKIMRKNNVIQQMQQSAIKFDLKLMQELQSEVVNLARQAEELESLIEDLSAWFSHKGQYAVSVVECQQGRNSTATND